MTTWLDPRTGRPADVKDIPGTHHHHYPFSSSIPAFESPPSPLSLMDVITVGSPVALDHRSSAAPLSPTTSSSTTSALTATSPGDGASIGGLPQEERLLPVGGGERPQGIGAKRGEGILDRVWQVGTIGIVAYYYYARSIANRSR